MVERVVNQPADIPFGADLAEVDAAISLLIAREEARQAAKLIMIPSESVAPRAVRAALSSVFTNIYAEGYPALRTSEEEIASLSLIEGQLALHRRYADRRYYKGTELVNLVETLAQRRVAALFATERMPASGIHANVQALSGAAANNAVYTALLEPGDTMLGLDLAHGGHLTHGSPHNRSGRQYHVVPYTVDLRTGRLDYEEIRRLALEHRPRLIVGGASAYPWDIDWQALRSAADAAGALLLADIAHPAGLVVAGLFPNPIGQAHAISFTTHKTLCGPRGAVILTTDASLARKIDRAVFPGEQGGPHINNIAAMAVAFAIARTPAFHSLQRQIVANAAALALALRDRGLSLVYGGTNTHMLLVDLHQLPSSTGYPLKADVASRILDLTGIVCNRNTMPGDTGAAQASALRFGTVWATQLGLREGAMAEVADIIHRTLSAIVPFRYFGPEGDLARGKLPFGALQSARQRVAALLPSSAATTPGHARPSATKPKALQISGPNARHFLQEVCAAQLLDLSAGECRPTALLAPQGQAIGEVLVTRLADDAMGRPTYVMASAQTDLGALSEWLGALSDGYVLFDEADPQAKIEGPVVASTLDRPAGRVNVPRPPDGVIDLDKPYFIGQRALLAKAPRPAKEEFRPAAYDGPPRQSSLYQEHLRLTNGRNMATFGGWTMPLWYRSIREEHRAVRQAAGLFDVSHMGVFEIAGPDAGRFLDLVTTNYVPLLRPGQSQYSYVLDLDGNVIDDIYLYCRSSDRYMLVANAANAERVEAWLAGVASRRFLIDRERPAVAVDAGAAIRNLKNATGREGRVDMALQGPQSWRVLATTITDEALAARVARLRRNEFVEGEVAGAPAIISRTGYTGEEIGFELYVPPEDAPIVWRALLSNGEPFGVQPVGLGARDSTRAEAGFPLYGHELAGPYQISPAGAGYGHFVKLHKPFFVGRRAFIACEAQRHAEIVRFRLNKRGARMLRQGDPVVDETGECIGHVTSCVVVDGQQVGMAYVARDRAWVAGTLRAFPRSRVRAGEAKTVGELTVGDYALLPEEGIVLPRLGL